MKTSKLVVPTKQGIDNGIENRFPLGQTRITADTYLCNDGIGLFVVVQYEINGMPYKIVRQHDFVTGLPVSNKVVAK